MHTEFNFEELVREHQAMVFRTLLRLTGTREHLDDLAQEVFLRFYRALGGFRGEALITTYLYRIVVNVAQDEWKRRRRERRETVSLAGNEEDGERDWEQRLPHPGRNAEEQLEDREFALAVEEQMARLRPLERAVLVLYHQEERSYEQIASTLEMPIGTVRTHLHRGRNKLRAALEAWRQENAGRKQVEGTPCEKMA